MQKQFGMLGERIRLECKVTSAANDNSISWDKNGNPIKSDNPKYDVTVTDREYEHVSELFINRADLSDFGSYGCKATNEIGSDYLVITMEQEGMETKVRINIQMFLFFSEIVESSEILYIVIGIFSIVILLLLLTLCIVLSTRRNRSNMKDVKAVNDQSNRR